MLLDTGVGGLTVLRELRKVLPNAPVIFAADEAGRPYGTKTEAEVAARVSGLLGRMAERYKPRLICIACNTASTIALDMVRDVLETPIVGTVPAIKPAALSSKTGVIGLLGTAGTIRQPYVDRLEKEFVGEGTLLRHAAPELVEPAEQKLRGEPVDRAVLAAALNALTEHPQGLYIDHVILGCTHFPLLKAELEDVAVFDLGWSPDVRFIDGSAGIARRIASLLKDEKYARSDPDFAVTTGNLDEFKRLSNVLEDLGLSRITQF
ncbi:glutamate racemase [Qipengyuania sp. DGS5-3]|uniref:glutamate racemase n=1 Tax=Qipengyuania sp. DGS5-3 TaxID=3349632 RepID=UPI0036D3E6B1